MSNKIINRQTIGMLLMGAGIGAEVANIIWNKKMKELLNYWQKQCEHLNNIYFATRTATSSVTKDET